MTPLRPIALFPVRYSGILFTARYSGSKRMYVDEVFPEYNKRTKVNTARQEEDELNVATIRSSYDRLSISSSSSHQDGSTSSTERKEDA